MGSGLNFFTNWTDKTPGTTGSWVDVDCSADIPSGATGVILRLVNTNSGTSYGCHVRKNGSTDSDTSYIKVRVLGHVYALIGVDANRIFEAYLENAAIKVYLVGYTDSAVTFFTDPYDKSLTTTGAWTDVDCSGEVPSGATGVILRIRKASGSSTNHYGAVRKNGSTDNDTSNHNLVISGHHWALIGIDANRIFEGYINDLSIDFFLCGYTTNPVTFFDNEKDESLTVTGAWTDIDATADTEASADGIIVRIVNTSTSVYKGAIRKNGSTDNDTTNSQIRTNGSVWALCGMDSEQIYEGYIQSVAIDFKAIGYAKPAAEETYVNVSDAGAGVDVPALEAQLAIAESGVGSDAPEIRCSFTISDTGLGSDILQSIGLPITDLGAGSETVNISVSVPITDLGSSAELIDLLTQIQILDGGTGSESVTAGPPTAIKTKIFLIFGGLAIQLTGD